MNRDIMNRGQGEDTPRRRPRVLIIENDPEVREANVAKLTYWGYEPVIAEGRGRALLKDAREKARACCCQLALADMHLLDDYDHEDWSGLHLVPDLLPARTVIYSGSCNYQAVRGALNEFKALDFVGKSEGPEYLREVLDRHSVSLCACRRDLNIVWPEGWSSERVAEIFARDKAIPPDEADDVLARLFPNAAQLALRFLSGYNPSSHSMPRPRSLVLQASEDGGQPVIVKLATQQKIEKEVENYEQYIKKNLVGSYRPTLQADHAQWNIGGAVYSFVGISERIIPLAQYYPIARARAIKSILRHFFTVTWSPMYERVTTGEDSTLFDAYCKVWHGDWWVERLIADQQEGLFPSVNAGWAGAAGLGLPEPVPWLVKRARSGQAGFLDFMPMAVTHGDLHSENLMVDSGNQNAWVIDFERTGEGPVLQDFTELETDMINHLVVLGDDEEDLFYALAVCASQPHRLGKLALPQAGDARVIKILDIVSSLRRIAADCTGVTDAQEYLWGVLFNALFRALILINEKNAGSQLRRTLLLSAIVCHRLDHWEELWPPAAWPTVEQAINPVSPGQGGQHNIETITDEDEEHE